MQILSKNEAVLTSAGDERLCLCATYNDVPLWSYTSTANECKKMCCNENHAYSYSFADGLSGKCDIINALAYYTKHVDPHNGITALARYANIK